MDEDQLAELEMHIAAGTPIPEAFAALPTKSEPQSTWPQLIGAIVAILAVLCVAWLIY